MKILLATNNFFDYILPAKEIENLLITPENSVLFKRMVTGSLKGSVEVLNKQDQISFISVKASTESVLFSDNTAC